MSWKRPRQVRGPGRTAPDTPRGQQGRPLPTQSGPSTTTGPIEMCRSRVSLTPTPRGRRTGMLEFESRPQTRRRRLLTGSSEKGRVGGVGLGFEFHAILPRDIRPVSRTPRANNRRQRGVTTPTPPPAYYPRRYYVGGPCLAEGYITSPLFLKRLGGQHHRLGAAEPVLQGGRVRC